MIRSRIRDGEPVWQLRCPGCDRWADIDEDQLHGRASVDHTVGLEGDESDGGCGFHERRDWFSEAARPT